MRVKVSWFSLVSQRLSRSVSIFEADEGVVGERTGSRVLWILSRGMAKSPGAVDANDRGIRLRWPCPGPADEPGSSRSRGGPGETVDGSMTRRGLGERDIGAGWWCEGGQDGAGW